MDNTCFWYLASPYSKYIGGIGAAFRIAGENAAHLVRAGVAVFSPIVHSHIIAIRGAIDPFDHSIWMPLDAPLMAAARGLIVLQADGWDESRGVAIEIETFKAAHKPVFYMLPGPVSELLADEIRGCLAVQVTA
ncbi:MAG: hypothetical protein JWO51_181 [Rhodospirillales bacterium]|nr:hypothetical protein [Rhodospirillales bacterium]